MSEKELSGRVALVTGAGRNIGRAMAKALAAGGAAIIVNVRSNKAEAEQVVREIERDGGKAIAAVFDVADEKAVTGGVAEAAKQLGRLDYLINNAALRQERAFEEMSFKEWRDVLGVTLDGAFHCAKACLPYLQAERRGRDRQHRRAFGAHRLGASRACDGREARPGRLHARARARSCAASSRSISSRPAPSTRRAIPRPRSPRIT